MLYSDDHGATWHRSAPIPVSDSYPIGEPRVFQRADGTVVINGRWGSGGTRYRIVSTSTDGGTTWSNPVIDGALPQFISIDAGLVRYTADGVDRVIYSFRSRRPGCTRWVSGTPPTRTAPRTPRTW